MVNLLEVHQALPITLDFSNLVLIGDNLSDCNFDHSTLDYAELDCAVLTRLSFQNARLHYTSLFGANLERANLSHADVAYSDFRQANLENTQLEGVNFTNSKVKGAIFTDAQGLSLEQKKWLKSHGALNVPK